MEKITDTREEIMGPVYLRNLPPPDETFHHPSFLFAMAMWIKPVNYLELGVRYGDTFFRIADQAKMCIGVDTDFSVLKWAVKPNMKLFKTTTDKFFENLDENFQRICR